MCCSPYRRNQSDPYADFAEFLRENQAGVQSAEPRLPTKSPLLGAPYSPETKR
jgi:hypothetical protein